MATINAKTLDHVARTQFFRLNAHGALEALPFAHAVLDHDAVFFEPTPLPSLEGRSRTGRTTGQVVLDKNRPLPLVQPPARQHEHGVWFYAGV
jgi:hypothetical protein